MAKNTIYYVFTLPPVSGGHFVSLEHIAALNAMGFNAKVYYVGAPDGFAKFTVPAVRAGAPLLSDDIVVVGEDHKALLKELRNRAQRFQRPAFEGHRCAAAHQAGAPLGAGLFRDG